MRTPVKPALFASSVVLLGAIAACNGVLGIEEAALDQESGDSTLGATCTLPQDDPTAECVLSVGDPCEDCLGRRAAGLTSRCLTTPAAVGDLKSCREALVDYRLCIGDNCQDENGNCAACLTGSSLARELGLNVKECPECRQSGIASLCEEYCACMGEKCRTKQPADCETACVTNLTPYQRYCRWQHCERATEETSRHCGHAVGAEGACAEDAADPAGVCDGVWTGLGCDDSNECCSQVCSGGICTTD
jgi:hypothetical protein